MRFYSGTVYHLNFWSYKLFFETFRLLVYIKIVLNLIYFSFSWLDFCHLLQFYVDKCAYKWILFKFFNWLNIKASIFHSPDQIYVLYLSFISIHVNINECFSTDWIFKHIPSRILINPSSIQVITFISAQLKITSALFISLIDIGLNQRT